MLDELKDFDEELSKLCGEIRNGIDGLKKLSGTDRSQKVKYLQDRITRAKEVYKSYRVEMRDLDKTVKEPYERKGKEYNETINKLIQDLNWAQDTDKLMDGGTKPVDRDAMNADQLLAEGAKVQEKTLKSVDRTLNTLDNTRNVAANTAAKLREQSEQLKRVGEDLNQVESNLKMAGRELKSFTRRMATDKIIMVFMCLIVLGVAFIIIYSIVKPDADTNVPDDFKPN